MLLPSGKATQQNPTGKFLEVSVVNWRSVTFNSKARRPELLLLVLVAVVMVVMIVKKIAPSTANPSRHDLPFRQRPY
jgi:hypothetical protein